MNYCNQAGTLFFACPLTLLDIKNEQTTNQSTFCNSANYI